MPSNMNANTNAEQTVRQTRATAFEQIAVGVAHDLRNPLSVILNAVYLLRRGAAGQAPRDLEILRIVETEVRAANELLSGLVELAARAPEKETFDCAALLAEELARNDAPGAAPVRCELPRGPFPIWADPLQFRYVLETLLRRFAKNPGARGDVVFTTRRTGPEGTELVMARSGAPSAQPVSLKESKSPSLALLLCREIIERHQGSFQYLDAATGEMRVVIQLPSETPPAAARSAEAR